MTSIRVYSGDIIIVSSSHHVVCVLLHNLEKEFALNGTSGGGTRAACFRGGAKVWSQAKAHALTDREGAAGRWTQARRWVTTSAQEGKP
jgi:hypothetical protein